MYNEQARPRHGCTYRQRSVSYKLLELQVSDVNVETAMRENALYASKGSVTQLINFTRRNPTEV